MAATEAIEIARECASPAFSRSNVTKNPSTPAGVNAESAYGSLLKGNGALRDRWPGRPTYDGKERR
jgi:hypothetical protein